MTHSEITPLGKYSVKVESKGMREYYMRDGELVCETNIDCGTF